MAPFRWRLHGELEGLRTRHREDLIVQFGQAIAG
jgi:hypothetical protein